jgi:lipopolysaccharide export system protein LptA
MCVGSAHAEKADSAKPINIESDSLRYDDLKQVSVFTGNVIFTKGTIVIRGSQVEVRQDPEGYQSGRITSEPGKLASFRQKREGQDEYIEAEGEIIEYDGRTDVLRFRSNARLRRLRGAVVADELSGNLIQYNSATDVFTVDGGTVKSGAGTTVQGRVRAMLTPRQDTATPPAAVAPGPAAVPAEQPQPQLRSTTTLGEEKK